MPYWNSADDSCETGKTQILNQLRINQRLWGLLGFIIVAVLGLSAYMLSNQHTLLMQQKALEVQSVVETAASVATDFHDRAERGEMDTEAARAAALEAI